MHVFVPFMDEKSFLPRSKSFLKFASSFDSLLEQQKPEAKTRGIAEFSFPFDHLLPLLLIERVAQRDQKPPVSYQQL